jgi:hypothetical protein
MNATELLIARAEAGDQDALVAVRAAIRAGTITVARMGSADGSTRSVPLPASVEDAPPPRGRTTGRRRTPQQGTSVAAPPRVILTEAAYIELREEIFEFDGAEVGGALLGQRIDGKVIVEQVAGPNEWTQRNVDTIQVDRDRALLLERATGLTWVGDWHSHAEREPKPSQPDFRGWVGCVRRSLGLYVGIVGTVWTPDADWVHHEPRFSCWVAQDGRCRPVTLEIGESW